MHPDIGVAWIRALTLQWPGMSLADIHRIDEDLLPALLADPSQYTMLSVSLLCAHIVWVVFVSRQGPVRVDSNIQAVGRVESGMPAGSAPFSSHLNTLSTRLPGNTRMSNHTVWLCIFSHPHGHMSFFHGACNFDIGHHRQLSFSPQLLSAVTPCFQGKYAKQKLKYAKQ